MHSFLHGLQGFKSLTDWHWLVGRFFVCALFVLRLQDFVQQENKKNSYQRQC